MDEGIGRGGYRMLAVVFFVVGVVGLLVTWYANWQNAGAFQWIGIAMSAAAFVFLLSLTMAVSNLPAKRPARKQAWGSPPPSKKEEEKPDLEERTKGKEQDLGIPADAGPVTFEEPTFEYRDPQPAPKAAPEEMILPESFEKDGIVPPHAAPLEEVTVPPVMAPDQSGKPRMKPNTDRPRKLSQKPPQTGPKDPAAWPQQTGVSNWTKEQARKEDTNKFAERRPRDELTSKYTEAAPVIREILTTKTGGQVKTRKDTPMADNLPASKIKPVPKEKVRGKCGRCDTMLLVPTTPRPLQVKCPVCAKVNTLQ